VPPPWQPTDPCQLSPAATVVPPKQVPLGVTVVAVLQLSFAGWAKIIAKENNKKTSVTDFFNSKMFQKLFSQHFTGKVFLKYIRS
jgi:hypothetical protein